MADRPDSPGVQTFADPPAVSRLDQNVEPLRRNLRRLGLVLLFVLILLPALQVFLRSVVGTPFVGAEELARFMLICVVFLTLPYVVSSGANIRMEELISSLPRRVQWPLRVAIAATAAAAFGVAAYSVAVATLRNLDNATPTLGIPYWVFFSAAFIGLFVSAVESGVQCVKALAGRPLYVTFAEEQPPEEVDLDRALAHEASAGQNP
jgi:TRAP-type C4-dicarboxylate transport system permease small subunit